jgi:predicted phosphodiesterase
VSLGDSLAAEYAKAGPSSASPTRGRQGAPKGFEPGIRYDGGVPVEITTDLVSEAPTEDEWRHIVEGMGIVMPDGWRLVLVEARFDPAAWTREQPFVPGTEDTTQRKMPATTRPAWRYRFRVEQVATALGTVADELLAAIDRWRPQKSAYANNPARDAFTVVYADMQIGKWEPAAGGTDRTVARILALTDQALAEYRALAKRGTVGPVALVFPGDGCEGYVSQGGRLIARTDLFPTEMVRVYRRLVAHAVMAFAKVAPAVAVIAVGGNHDQSTRQVETAHHDSWDVDAAAAVCERLADQPEKFGHVTWHMPSQDSDVVTVDLAGTIVAVAHGHQFKGGAQKWWAGQSHGMRPAGEATLLLSGHLHHLLVTQTGARTHVQAPALDNGSEWWARETGDSAPSGLLTLTVGRGGWDRLRVLTWAGDEPCASS